jgi:hypothetical protein
MRSEERGEWYGEVEIREGAIDGGEGDGDEWE